jgi:hypothetical protein
MSRRRSILLIAVALIVGAAFIGWEHFPRDTTSRTTVGQAISKFRQNAERGEGLPGAPELGVYRYAVKGGEELDTTFVSGSHDYGGVSTIAITPSRCGVEERWQVLAERWTEAEVCRTAGGSRLEAVRDSREFFGQVEFTSFSCQGDEVPKAADLRAGMSWTVACASEDASVETEIRVTEIGRVEVAGRAFDALHTTSSITLAGKVSGTDERDEWRRRSDGLLLRRTVATEASVDVVAGGSYSERYSLRLLSVKPRR